MVIGQERALEALRFGAGIRRDGYNLFAVGPTGVGKQTMLRAYLAQRAGSEEAGRDLCYVHDFARPEAPRALALPAGEGARLQRDMAAAVLQLRVAMRAAFDSEAYRTRRQGLLEQFGERQEAAISQVRARAAQRDVAVQRAESGIEIAPIHNGSVLEPEAFRKLPESEQQRLRSEMERVSEDLQALMRQLHDWGHEQQDALRALDAETAGAAVRRVLQALRNGYAALPDVVSYLAQVEADMVDSAEQFVTELPEGFDAALRRALAQGRDGPAMRRYHVNVLVQREVQAPAPVVYEDHPTHANLVGRIEHEAQFGALSTDFTLLKGGAFHRARGGYLLLDALKLLQQPLAWDAVKRTIRTGEIRIEALGEALGWPSTVSLRPAPIPLGDTKVVLMGERTLYYLLATLDPEFSELFKVLVDFEESVERGPETPATYATMLATLIRSKGLRAFDREALACVIDHAARAANDAGKLSLHMRSIVDLLQEADYWAGENGRELVGRREVRRAIDAQLERSGHVPARLQEAITRGDVQISTQGNSIGQGNGLAVYQLGERVVGHPTRISARVRMGKGEVVDIEREVKLGGPLHSKGVLILAGYVSGHYATSVPLSLSATIVFEQSYGVVEGDSASLAELCVLLSAIAGVALAQSLAVTGSVDQHGRVQAIGAVNEKVEGFFDVCRARGLDGQHGVIIPASNAKNLMLREDVAEAIGAGQFHVYTVETLDDALELLTGAAAGGRDAEGRFPQGSFNALVEAQLTGFAERARTFARGQA